MRSPRAAFLSDYEAQRATLAAPTAREIESRLIALASAASNASCTLKTSVVGSSREGRAIHGIIIGEGPLHVSITAGAHSDEPGGPLAALALADWLVRQPELRSKTTWRICPHVNPDGAEVNAAWFAEPPKLDSYVESVHRDLPGEDVEFNYPAPTDSPKTPRKENIAVADFLREGAPYHLHASLHGMGFAEGAWWLIGEKWAARTGALRGSLRAHFQSLDIGVHDIERNGDKGFTRIERGFSTTPTSLAMRDYFLREGDTETADLFLPSSMELVESFGGDPLVMVSEIPIFRIHGGGEFPDPPGDDTPFMRFRPRLRQLKSTAGAGATADLANLFKEFDVRPVPFSTQVKAIAGGVLLAVEFLLQDHGAAQ